MINITIDGHSGSGKSSTAKAVAKALNYTYIDTGAMYRAVTLAVLEDNINIEDKEELSRFLEAVSISFRKGSDGENHTFLNDRDVEQDIRSHEVASFVSEVSRVPEVRKQLVVWQRMLAKEKGVVMEGRDAGTVVLPDADLKVFMTAALDIRAKRRWEEMKAKGMEVGLEEIIENLKHRDHLDSTREVAPLRKADGAIDLDTSTLSFKEQVLAIVSLALEKMKD